MGRKFAININQRCVSLFTWPHDLRVTNPQGLLKIAKVIDRTKTASIKKTITKTDILGTKLVKVIIFA